MGAAKAIMALNLWESFLDLLSKSSIFVVDIIGHLSPRLAELLSGNPAIFVPVILIVIVLLVVTSSLIKWISRENK